MSAHASTSDILIFAAASTAGSVSKIVQTFTKKTSIKVRAVFGASGALARQIDRGAPANIFLSANPKWMDWLERRNRLQSSTRHNYVGNCLVVVQKNGEPYLAKFAPGFLRGIENARFAMGDPSYVPVGEYAKSVLERLGIWAEIEPHILYLPSSRHVMRLVERGEANAGYAYRSDARMNSRVQISEYLPSALHPEIVYPIAVVGEQDPNFEILSLFSFMFTPPAVSIFEKNGFRRLDTQCPN